MCVAVNYKTIFVEPAFYPNVFYPGPGQEDFYKTYKKFLSWTVRRDKGDITICHQNCLRPIIDKTGFSTMDIARKRIHPFLS